MTKSNGRELLNAVAKIYLIWKEDQTKCSNLIHSINQSELPNYLGGNAALDRYKFAITVWNLIPYQDRHEIYSKLNKSLSKISQDNLLSIIVTSQGLVLDFEKAGKIVITATH